MKEGRHGNVPYMKHLHKQNKSVTESRSVIPWGWETGRKDIQEETLRGAGNASNLDCGDGYVTPKGEGKRLQFLSYSKDKNSDRRQSVV